MWLSSAVGASFVNIEPFLSFWGKGTEGNRLISKGKGFNILQNVIVDNWGLESICTYLHLSPLRCGDIQLYIWWKKTEKLGKGTGSHWDWMVIGGRGIKEKAVRKGEAGWPEGPSTCHPTMEVGVALGEGVSTWCTCAVLSVASSVSCWFHHVIMTWWWWLACHKRSHPAATPPCPWHLILHMLANNATCRVSSWLWLMLVDRQVIPPQQIFSIHPAIIPYA